MKVKNGNQYKIQKSQDEGGNNAYKIFTRWVEEGYIPSTISHVELFMNTMKKKARMGEGVMSIKLFCAGWRREILYANPVSCLELFIATTEKEKIS